MRRATEHAAAGGWPTSERRARATLDYDARSRRRIRLSDDDGGLFLLDLPMAVVLRSGDGLRLENGGWIEVCAAPEGLTEITCHDIRHLVRVAWHLGNRHLPAELDGTTIYIRRDHVIESMLRGLGAEVHPVERAFNPEGGAYGGHALDPGHGHVHGHGHGHGHGHDHGEAGEYGHGQTLRHDLLRPAGTTAPEPEHQLDGRFPAKEKR